MLFTYGFHCKLASMKKDAPYSPVDRISSATPDIPKLLSFCKEFIDTSLDPYLVEQRSHAQIADGKEPFPVELNISSYSEEPQISASMEALWVTWVRDILIV
jgi:hypothetical protein